MFFSKKDEPDDNPELSLVLDRIGLSPVSAEEWSELLPETRERAQGPSLGFCCGGAPRKGAGDPSFMPDFPLISFVSDYIIEPKCWQDQQICFTIHPEPDTAFRLVGQYAARPVITVTSAITDRPPSFRVYGSYCFFGPPYVLAPVPPLKI
ncbi:MAG: hypothetical protein IJS14_02020 [Lentisphaeria bacterium]|nr:hypothetical protein [Lentisphaeria bacterium]